MDGIASAEVKATAREAVDGADVVVQCRGLRARGGAPVDDERLAA